MLTSDADLVLRLMEDTVDDYELLARWLSDPRVLEYYEGRDQPYDRERVEEKYSPRALGDERVTPCILELEGRPIGYVQFYPLEQPELDRYEIDEAGNPYGFDIFIGEPGYWGQGFGTRAVSMTIGMLFDRGAGIVTADPRVTNPRAVRAYEKAGMTILKRLSRHEFHEGEWHENWLMAAEPE